ncbi:MAG TPA: MFS transporter, partial [Alphaproteobacteria bacterium]|nr:MFS transporter [Alphaproteobacteria bacterium]
MSQTETRTAPSAGETSIFRIRPFQLMFFTRLASMMSNQMLALVVGWQVYALTESPMALGLIGLVQLMPALCFALFSGEVADRFDRRLVLRWVYVAQTSVLVGFLLVSLMPQPHVGLLYALLFVNALSRTFESPALQSLLP